MIIATAGHVDHGKTALVKAITGIDTDSLADEQRRGLTIDLGFAYQQEGDRQLGFVDVPGHVKFINNMLAGVSGIDHALLIIAADDGPMPQTLEHLAILNLLGVDTATLAITKTDRVSSERLAEVIEEVKALIASTSLTSAPLYPVSAITGEGVNELKSHLLDQAGNVRRDGSSGRFRLSIDRCFNIKGSGLVVTGSVFAGQVGVGDELMLMPAGIPCRVRGIHAQNLKTDSGQKGERCAINLTGSGLSRDLVHRGDWLSHPDLANATTRFDAELIILDQTGPQIKHLSAIHLHSAASHVMGRIALLESPVPGSPCLVQFIVEEPLCLCRGDRYIIRDQSASNTLGGGRVIDPFAPAKGRLKRTRLEQLRMLAIDDAEESLSKLLNSNGEGVNLTEFVLSRNLDAPDASRLFGTLVTNRVSITQRGHDYLYGFTGQHWDDLKSRIRETLIAWHKNNPAAVGIDGRQLRNLLSHAPRVEVFDAAVVDLVAARQLLKSGASLSVPGHTASLGRDDEKIWQKVRSQLLGSDLKPPVTHDLARDCQISVTELEQFIKRAIPMGLIVRATRNRIFLPTQIQQLHALLTDLHKSSGDGMFSASEYRDVSGLGRNLAIEVLEYFDRAGVTQRVGDQRRLIKHELEAR